MNPQIDFKHVLGELSVNRNNPCEIMRELVSNSYDAAATLIRYVGIESVFGFIFWDNGVGLHRSEKKNGITPYEAFFSIGKSTKTKGEAIGYKCQGSKLCFASNRVLVLSKTIDTDKWYWKIVENPRNTLDTKISIIPEETNSPWEIISQFYPTSKADSAQATRLFGEDFFKHNNTQGTLIAVQGVDVEDFQKYLLGKDPIETTYIFNYMRFCTRHGDTRMLSEAQGFRSAHVKQVEANLRACSLEIYDGKQFKSVPFGYPYLSAALETDAKSPLEVARLKDANFTARYAKCFKFANNVYSLILAIDANRRAHKGYSMLDRKGAPKSGLRLVDQRGAAISVNGIKICRYNEIFERNELAEYEILGETESIQHYLLIIDGPFDLVTNRNSLSKSSAGAFEQPTFLLEIKRFLDDAKRNLPIFEQLLVRLSKEQRETALDQQITILNESKNSVTNRERFRINEELYVSPVPGEEYLVGVLYATLSGKIGTASKYAPYWKKIYTFSTQGIDSIGIEKNCSMERSKLISVEYKYAFSNKGPFNHALCLVDQIVAWDVVLDDGDDIRDQYHCFGKIKKIEEGIFHITDIEAEDGASYHAHVVVIVSLKILIEKSFPKVSYRTPPARGR